ncbi:hypothetical protein ELY21_13280 [Legionella sp. km535]|nr:hypothetical protein ELY21_13280 [Legionella sp. km535]
MLWILVSLFFCWLIYRELNGHMPVFKPYVTVLLLLAFAFAWAPVQHWRTERLLTAIASQLADNHLVKVHCNTLFDTLFDEDPRVGGHTDPKTGHIVIQYPRCSILMNYRTHPDHASPEEIISLNILTHESMHARGEYNEAKTECQAVQRNYRTARLLGVPEPIAKKNALEYYKNHYLTRSDGYFSKECAPGKSMDEHLSDSIWNE